MLMIINAFLTIIFVEKLKIAMMYYFADPYWSGCRNWHKSINANRRNARQCLSASRWSKSKVGAFHFTLWMRLTFVNRLTFQPSYFDLVHSQNMATGIHANRWTQYLRDMFRVLRGGGWCQMVEIYYNVQSDNGSLTDGNSRYGGLVPEHKLI
jgi:hypothetical protein